MSYIDQPVLINHECSFILRLWRVNQPSTPAWRASLEIPVTGKRIGFASLEQLFAFLMDLSESDTDHQQANADEPCDFSAYPPR